MKNENKMRAATLACLLGLHAYSNGVCVNCGKKRK